ncbi:MAG: FeoA family protein [Sulfurovum sp.]|nr:FeoA family protein [Sulfurovum sp.]
METTLFDLKSGEEAVIKNLKGGAEFQKKLRSLNLRRGKMIRKVTAEPFHGPVVVEIDNTEIAIGMNMAKKIVVEASESESD